MATSESIIDELRKTINDSCSDPTMVVSFIVNAEVVDENGEVSMLTWHDGGTYWSKIGMLRLAESELTNAMHVCGVVRDEDGDEDE